MSLGISSGFLRRLHRGLDGIHARLLRKGTELDAGHFLCLAALLHHKERLIVQRLDLG